ncbi:DMT family transporter [Stakelama sediminis]|uniref:Drug/metabolite transporter (DMT)-like permease n=1 Tax=Stakelama sediminis TaxID=463200 RepID=A0A840YVD0_9SPHN|nr:DMT family transporter [Stakelama sediminis]MBB5717505.1 drug/metabolite transporter (DMT)-like permease [Stakelama sediminis]
MPREDRILTGLALRLLSAFCLASLAALIKLAQAQGAKLPEIMFFRQCVAVPMLFIIIAAGPGLSVLRPKRFRPIVVRTIVGLIGMVFNFGAILLLPLPEATTLQFTAPIFATILGALVLREPTGWHRWGAVALGFVGVLIVAQPGSGDIPLTGALVGLTAAFLIASIAILLRHIGQTEHPLTTVFWFSLLSVPVLTIPYFFFAQPHPAETWIVLASIGMVGGLGQLALTSSVRFAPVSTVVPMDYSSLVWATVYSWWLFAVLPPAATWVGAPVIIISGLYIVWREHRLKLRAATTAA